MKQSLVDSDSCGVVKYKRRHRDYGMDPQSRCFLPLLEGGSVEEALGPHSDVVRPMCFMGHLLSLRVWLRALLFEGERTKRKFMTAVLVTAVLFSLRRHDDRAVALIN